MAGPSTRVEAMWRIYERGVSMGAIAADFGVREKRVSALFRKYGYPVERAGPRVLRSIRLLHMYSLYERGLSTREIGERFGVTGDHVRSLFYGAGFRLRPPGRQQLTSDERAASARQRLGP